MRDAASIQERKEFTGARHHRGQVSSPLFMHAQFLNGSLLVRPVHHLVKRFESLGWGSVLLIDGVELDAGLVRAARNIPEVDVLPQQGANVYDILRRDTLVLTRDAVQALEARLK